MVEFRYNRNRIIIRLEPEATFEEIKANLIKTLEQNKNFYKDSQVKYVFGGRVLSREEEAVLKDIIIEISGGDFTYAKESAPRFSVLRFNPLIERRKERIRRRELRSFNLKVSETENLFKNAINEINGINEPSETEKKVLFRENALRCGQKIEYDGSVVIYGDVNPGSEIIATGNIIALGALRGFARAGVKGDKNCKVFAARLYSTQISIAHVYEVVLIDSFKESVMARLKDGEMDLRKI